MAGRKSKYTPDMLARLCEAIGKGSTYKLACAYAGIGHTMFNEWLNTIPEFSAAVKKAEGESVARWLDLIEQGAQEGAWQAAAWKLERRYPQEYGKTVQEQQHSGEQRLVIEHVNDWRKHGTTPTPTDGEGGAS